MVENLAAERQEKCNVSDQEIMAEPTGRSAILKFPRDWHLHWNKCLFFSQNSRPWNEGRADCSVKDDTLLLIQDKKELRLIQDVSNRKGHQFSIGLRYVPMEKIWKWINGSTLNLDQLQVTGKEEENSCALISGTKVFSDTCSADNHWICQKKLKHE
ncbi:killer cell lectin-like receptor subfamily B member 1 [Chionomys nivalis]|uniref:killer cell lectin-like receptor subfamily B member 1 n=1 Tax=Chionomys nivalis TaxID=269649 RepID=UPI002594603E|nr:killer cell lectin-like receptor subfamily B member 1 [Chionomys nivalis]